MPNTIDEALEILHHTGPEFGGGLSNHGPMAVEAMIAMNRPDGVIDWVESYKSRLHDRPEASNPISREQWRETLGDVKRVADWVVFFDSELADSPWQDVVKNWVPQLAPGLMAAATHGIIRTSHAVRSLSAIETPQRLHELAEGLGYWAARFQVLPGSPSGMDAGRLPREAIEQVRRVHGPHFQARGLIFEQVKGLDEESSFADVIDHVSTDGDLSQFISQLTESFAGIYQANQTHLVSFVHSVTAPSALRILVPYLSDVDARLAARYAWQACAAIYAWYDTASGLLRADTAQPVEQDDELIDRAIATGGPHTIKFTEACLREYALNPSPVYLAAARDATERVGAT